jgi:hypothetical protein
MFYFLMAVFITFGDLSYIKMWLISRGESYLASIGDWVSYFRNALFLALDSNFKVSTMNLANFFVISIFLGSTINKPCIIPLFF